MYCKFVSTLEQKKQLPAVFSEEYFNNVFSRVRSEAAKILKALGFEATEQDPLFNKHIELHRKVSIQFYELQKCGDDPQSLRAYLAKVTAQGFGVGRLGDLLESEVAKSKKEKIIKNVIIPNLKLLQTLIKDISNKELVLYNIIHDIAKIYKYPKHEENSAYIYSKLEAYLNTSLELTLSQEQTLIFETVIFYHVQFALIWIDGNWAALENLINPSEVDFCSSYKRDFSKKMDKILNNKKLKASFCKYLSLFTILDICAADGKRGYLNNLRMHYIPLSIAEIENCDFSDPKQLVRSRQTQIDMNEYRNNILLASLFFVNNSDFPEIQHKAKALMNKEMQLNDYPEMILKKAKDRSVTIIKRDYVHSLYVLLGTGTVTSSDIFHDYSTYCKFNLLLALGCKKGNITYLTYKDGKNFSRLAEVEVLRKKIAAFWQHNILPNQKSLEKEVLNIREFLQTCFLIEYSDNKF